MALSSCSIKGDEWNQGIDVNCAQLSNWHKIEGPIYSLLSIAKHTFVWNLCVYRLYPVKILLKYDRVSLTSLKTKNIKNN